MNDLNELISLKLTGLGECGDTTGEYEGQRVNVFGGIAGETVEARVIRRNNAATEAIVENVIEPSPHRRTPPCPYFGECSGCQWQHISYPFQLELKQELIRRALESEGINDVVVRPVLPSPSELGYRNHARLTVRRRLNQFGFINRITRRFVPVDHCLLMAEGVNSLMSALSGRCAETTQFSIRYGVNTDDYLIQPKLKN
ncbi:MAG: class I SAM-dependent RNA methyltransferase, partial [Dehalococcoidia bacterium]